MMSPTINSKWFSGGKDKGEQGWCYIKAKMKMKNAKQNIQLVTIKKSLLPFVEEYGIVKAYLFGSYARNVESNQSDIDILIEFNKDFDLIKFNHLINSLEESLAKKVDIVEFCTINPLFRESVLKDTILLYESR
ncbi:MAG TPA: nucleotidyltransferase domain-containing protein [Caldisericia bacterium]|nr:nucleotidyltransferase domain-containing protein [Caldisericia bacterium]